MINLLNSNGINVNTILIVVAIVAVIAVIFGVLIVTVSKVCHVEEDERIGKTQELLSGANCGGCGFAGCADFAKAVVEGRASLESCNATANENKAQIASILGIPFSATEEMVAVVKCAGGNNAKDKFDYVGNLSCASINSFFKGNKACIDGCLAGGSCAIACQENGVSIKAGVAVVDRNNCVACKACVNACPKQIIELIPKSAKVYVACSNKCKGKEVLSVCSVGCIGCGLCAKNCPSQAITMENNLAVIDYTKCSGCGVCVQKCPRHTIKET